MNIGPIRCTKCGGDKVCVEPEKEQEKGNGSITMDDFKRSITSPVPAVYKLTTLICKDCGYSVSY